MRAPYTQLYFHLVWATWDRLPLLRGSVREVAYDALQAEGRDAGVDLISIGGTGDHVHLLVRTPATVTISRLVQQLKGASSHLVNSALHQQSNFKWQGGHGAFSVSRRAVHLVRDYILNQDVHHRRGSTYPGCEPDPRPAPAPAGRTVDRRESPQGDFVPLLPRVHSPGNPGSPALPALNLI